MTESAALTPVVLGPEPGASPPDRRRTDPGITVPRLIADARPDAAEKFLEFFAAQIANPNTRAAYARATSRFIRWCEDRALELRQITPLHVSAYVRTHPGAAPTVKQHLAAIRMLGNWLVINQIISDNPATVVRGPKHVVVQGATPVLPGSDAKRLLDLIDVGSVKGARDRALLSVMLYSFARVGAVLGMRRGDYSMRGSQAWLRLHEKGGKRLDIPAHHLAAQALDDYIAAGGLAQQEDAPLFQSLDGRSDRLTGRWLHRRNALLMIKRRALDAGLARDTCCHTFRATGITAYLLNHGTLEHAQRIAAHASPRTTKLYDRTPDEVTVTEIERIVIR